eukprot:CAMPEP_0113632012 /NCGR_PEP_ID=MMETSP0017_2-20120614/16637_1 /TAXON_ID=2856 /ORGANISM="Cylindrotheca closterium" /LENGTH=548 /DNA_ID=CAMNT_0000542547 /DNA_START=84 /DNA_END=1727 /DNA_ORIENTATION=- /assembly_acc=CAM_ASM_000147
MVQYHSRSPTTTILRSTASYSPSMPVSRFQSAGSSNRIFSMTAPYRQASSVLSFSSSSTESSDFITSSSSSNRSKFKEIPVNPSILSYIESIGIGIPKRNPVKRRLNRLRKKNNYDRNNDRGKGNFLTREEEAESLPSIRRMPSRIPPPPFAMPQSKATKIATTETESRPHSKKPINGKKNTRGKNDKHNRNINNNRSPKQTSNVKHAQQQPRHQQQQQQQQRSIQRYPVKCIASVGTAEESFPPGSLKVPEVAIAGRSNVGKSTLLNALLYGNHPKASQDHQDDDDSMPPSSYRNQRRRGKGPKPTARTAKLPKGLKAATSSKPGQTRTIDFYRLTAKINSRTTISNEDDDSDDDDDGKTGNISGDESSSSLEEKIVEETTKISLQLVDLPGYGFAYATDDKMEAWKSLMQDYILNRGKPLKRILLLIDARHGMKTADIEFMESLQQALLHNNKKQQQATSAQKNPTAKKQQKRELTPIQIVLTKCDLVSQADLARRVTQVRQQLSDSLIRQPSALPVMLVSAQMEGQRGVLELQKELASLVPGISS